GEQRGGERKEADLPVGEFARLEDALRKLREDEPEGREFLRLRHGKLRPAEGLRDGAVEIDRILPRPYERREDRRHVGAVLVKQRRGDGKAGLAQRRAAIRAEAVEEAPLRHRAAEGSDLGIVPGIAEKGDRRL